MTGQNNYQEYLSIDDSEMARKLSVVQYAGKSGSGPSGNEQSWNELPTCMHWCCSIASQNGLSLGPYAGTKPHLKQVWVSSCVTSWIYASRKPSKPSVCCTGIHTVQPLKRHDTELWGIVCQFGQPVCAVFMQNKNKKEKKIMFVYKDVAVVFMWQFNLCSYECLEEKVVGRQPWMYWDFSYRQPWSCAASQSSAAGRLLPTVSGLAVPGNRVSAYGPCVGPEKTEVFWYKVSCAADSAWWLHAT